MKTAPKKLIEKENGIYGGGDISGGRDIVGRARTSTARRDIYGGRDCVYVSRCLRHSGLHTLCGDIRKTALSF
jgi:hypothetical protein